MAKKSKALREAEAERDLFKQMLIDNNLYIEDREPTLLDEIEAIELDAAKRITAIADEVVERTGRDFSFKMVRDTPKKPGVSDTFRITFTDCCSQTEAVAKLVEYMKTNGDWISRREAVNWASQKMWANW